MEGPNVDSVIEPALAREAENGLVDVGAAHRDSNIDDVLAELDSELVGLKPVKARIREIASLLLVARLREKMELSTERPTLHMSFTGHPAPARPPSPCGWRRCCITWAMCAGAISWWPLATIW